MPIIMEPPAELDPRPGDETIAPEQILNFELFKRLKKPPKLDKLPGTFKLRRYAAGEEVLRQGEAGWTAFYILSTQDVHGLRSSQLRAAGDAGRNLLDQEIRRLTRQLEQVRQAPDPRADVRRVASVYLAVARPAERRPRGLAAWFHKRPARPAGKRPKYIPFDGPTDIDYDTLEACLYEGDLFGEMSCLTGQPRAATIVARRDCYMLEMLRHVYEPIQDDTGFKEQAERTYRQRVFEIHLRKLGIFADLTDEEFARIAHYFDPADVWPLLGKDQPIRSWPALCAGLAQAASQPGTPQGRVWEKLPERARRALRELLAPAGGVDEPFHTLRAPPSRVELVEGINAVLSDPELGEVEELKPLADHPDVREETADLPKKRKDWTERMVRRYNRSLLEALFPGLTCHRVELVTYQPGQLICDEHDRSDSLFIIRSGLVRVVKHVSCLLGSDDVEDWPKLCAELCKGKEQQSGPVRRLWDAISGAARQTLEAGAAGKPLENGQRTAILYNLNDVIKSRSFYDPALFKPLTAEGRVAAELQALHANREQWSDADVRRFNRRLLEALCPSLRPYQPPLEPYILAYRGRGDVLGELGVVHSQPRSATCIAHAHAPEIKGGGDDGLKSGSLILSQEGGSRTPAAVAAPPTGVVKTRGAPVEAVRISRHLFQRMVAKFPRLEARLKEMADGRQATSPAAPARPTGVERPSGVLSGLAVDLNLVQGQRLMLIDLESCTRCDECVKACVDAHDDGRSRLFLDGPRFDKYLVPTTCRSCMDPVCMTECPVGSIHRGDNQEMTIENWCIGCRRCAELCPYDSIQMHSLGLIPENAMGWRFAPAAALPPDAAWQAPGHDDGAWLVGSAPFPNDALLQMRLTEHVRRHGPAEAKHEGQVCFRYAFELDRRDYQPGTAFKMTVTSSDNAAKVWLNGQELKAEKRGQYALVLEKQPPAGGLRPGRNVLAVSAKATGDGRGKLLDVVLCEEHVPPGAEKAAEQLTERVVVRKAVVCDLCSSLSGGPRCVSACPHDAAFRLDFRREGQEVLHGYRERR